MNEVIVRIATELSRPLDKLLDDAMDGDPEPRDRVIQFLWDNKVGILRVLQAAAEQE